MKRHILLTATVVLFLPAIAWKSAKGQGTSDATVGVRTSIAADSTRPRPRAIEYSDAYGTRLKIHRIASYTMLPLFATEYVLGDRLMQINHADWIKPAHLVVSGGLGVLFTVNTVTGVWNLAEARNDPNGRTLRWIHSALMLASDAGFAYTGLKAGEAKQSPEARTRHKNQALVSFGLGTVGTVLMWVGNK